MVAMDSTLDASLSLHLGPAPSAAPAKMVCVHCQQAVSVPELRLAIQCGRPRCGQSAHALCAVEQGYAGVSEQLGLDGQYLCRLCGAKSDLLPYWQERLAAAAAGEGLALGQHLGLAARLLHKTRRPEVEGVQAQVEYAVAQLVAGQDADVIAKLLRQLAADATRVVSGEQQDGQRWLRVSQERLGLCRRFVTCCKRSWSGALLCFGAKAASELHWDTYHCLATL